MIVAVREGDARHPDGLRGSCHVVLHCIYIPEGAGGIVLAEATPARARCARSQVPWVVDGALWNMLLKVKI